jgi:hypothetical protein
MYGSPYKEYPVDVGEGTLWAESVRGYLETAALIDRRMLLPRKPVCTDPHRPASRGCPTCVDCFSRAT